MLLIGGEDNSVANSAALLEVAEKENYVASWCGFKKRFSPSEADLKQCKSADTPASAFQVLR